MLRGRVAHREKSLFAAPWIPTVCATEGRRQGRRYGLRQVDGSQRCADLLQLAGHQCA